MIPRLSRELTIPVGGLTLHVSHGHELGSPTAALLVASYSADILVFGHTHRALVTRMERGGGSVLIVNPGAAGPRRFNLKPSVAILTVSGRNADNGDPYALGTVARDGAGQTSTSGQPVPRYAGGGAGVCRPSLQSPEPSLPSGSLSRRRGAALSPIPRCHQFPSSRRRFRCRGHPPAAPGRRNAGSDTESRAGDSRRRSLPVRDSQRRDVPPLPSSAAHHFLYRRFSAHDRTGQIRHGRLTRSRPEWTRRAWPTGSAAVGSACHQSG